jgi:NADP-dependent 3-hydroxy acid dehydrogenase YdfG
MAEITDKVAIVSGARHGIGCAIALEMARRGVGDRGGGMFMN